jgi:hypothetical protein
MTRRKSTQLNRPSTVEDRRVEAGKIDGLLEAPVISADGTDCSNRIAVRKQTRKDPTYCWRAQPPHSARLPYLSAERPFFAYLSKLERELPVATDFARPAALFSVSAGGFFKLSCIPRCSVGGHCLSWRVA